MQYRNIFGQVNTTLRECKATKEKNAIRAQRRRVTCEHALGRFKRGFLALSSRDVRRLERNLGY